MSDCHIISHYPSDTLGTSIEYRSANLYNTYIMYNPADVRWHVLIDIMSQYYPCYYRIFGLNGVKTFNPTSTLDLFLLCNSKGTSTGVVVKGEKCLKVNRDNK